jgi:hypothetical protein
MRSAREKQAHACMAPRAPPRGVSHPLAVVIIISSAAAPYTAAGAKCAQEAEKADDDAATGCGASGEAYCAAIISARLRAM